MYIQYADEKTICNSLAKYKVGEIVIALSDINFDGGIIEKNTQLYITQIRISPNITIPKILENKLNEYVSAYDEYTFIYKLKSDVSSADEKTIELSSSEFERADSFTKDFAAQYRNKKKTKRVAAAKTLGKSVLIYLALIAILTAVFGIALILLLGLFNDNVKIGTAFIAASGAASVFAPIFIFASNKNTYFFLKAAYYHCIRKVR